MTTTRNPTARLKQTSAAAALRQSALILCLLQRVLLTLELLLKTGALLAQLISQMLAGM